MPKTVPIRVFIEEAEIIEQHRRRLSIERGGQRVTMAEAIRWLLNQPEAARQAARSEERGR